MSAGRNGIDPLVGWYKLAANSEAAKARKPGIEDVIGKTSRKARKKLSAAQGKKAFTREAS